MLRELSVTQRSFPLVAPFRIARGVKYAADVVTVELRQAGCIATYQDPAALLTAYARSPLAAE